MKRFYGTAGALLVALFAATPAYAGGKKYDSPKAVFDAFKEAAKKEDWKTVCDCLTDDSSKMLAGAMAAGSLFIKGFIDAFAEKDQTGKLKEIAKAIDDLLKKHSVTQETLGGLDFKELMQNAKADPDKMKKELAKVGAKIKNPCGFLTDFGAAAKKLPGKQGSPLESAANATLKDLDIKGDKATAKIVTMKDGKEKVEPIEFRKIDGGWKIEIPLPGAGASLNTPRPALADARNTRPVALAERRTQ
ncbi:MAG: hypothetical protein IT429_21935 [Gemmataceae bacterium]|nr:hypothetical protein [Gemmataceae bacterium]